MCFDLFDCSALFFFGLLLGWTRDKGQARVQLEGLIGALVSGFGSIAFVSPKQL